jgi:hypothetical protein
VTLFHRFVRVRSKLAVYLIHLTFFLGTKGHGEIRHEEGRLREDEARREDDRPHGYTQLHHTQGCAY